MKRTCSRKANKIVERLRFIHEKIFIYILSGQLLFSKPMVRSQIDLSNFQSGIYTIKVETSKGVLTKKFVKQ